MRISLIKSNKGNNELWREAYGWKSNTTKQIRQRNGIYVSVESGAIGALTDEIADSYIHMFNTFSFPTFDQYTHTAYKVSVQYADPSRTEGYWCTCSTNAKQFKCKHTVCIAVLRGMLRAPVEARVNVLGVANKRGRKPFVPPAYQRLPFHLVAPHLHPQQDPELLIAGAQPGIEVPLEPVEVQNHIAQGQIEEDEEDAAGEQYMENEQNEGGEENVEGEQDVENEQIEGGEENVAGEYDEDEDW